MWRAIKGSSFSCEEPKNVLHPFTREEPLKVLHLFTREEPLEALHGWRDKKITWWRTIKGSLRVKRWRTLDGSSRSYQEPIIVLHNKRPNTIHIRLLNFSCKHPHSLAVRMTDCEPEGAGWIPDALGNALL